jgi:hypothetical protein
MDEHGFSGADAWVASDRVSPEGAQRRKVVRKDMAGIRRSTKDFRASVPLAICWLASLGRTRPSRQRKMNVASDTQCHN